MGRSYLGADALRASVNADGPASSASGRELRRRPARPPARAARVPGDHPRLLPAISGTQSRISGHDRPYLPGWRLAVRRATMAQIGPEGSRECAPHGDRNRRGGLMILICQLTHRLRCGFPAPDIYRSCQRSRARGEFGRQPTAPRSARYRDQVAGGSEHHGTDLRCRDAPVRVRHQRPGIWRPAAARLPEAGTVSVQPRPAKSGASPPDASFLIRSPTFPHGTHRYRGIRAAPGGGSSGSRATCDARLPDRPAVGSA